MEIARTTRIPSVFLALTILLSLKTNAQNFKQGYIHIGENDSLFYESAGAGNTLIFIHDGLLHSKVWDEQFLHFSKDFKVVRYDRRGYGLSSDAVGEYSNMDDLFALYEQLKIDSACLIACSSGGALAIDFTLEHPEKVEALVLVGAVVGGFSYTKHMFNRGGTVPGHFENEQEEALYYASQDPYEIYEKNVRAREKATEWVKRFPQRVYSRSKHPHYTVQAYRRLHEIKIPALILVGEFDIPDVHAHAGAINAGIESSKRMIIPESGHLIPLEKPMVFNHIVLEFLMQ